MTDSPLLLSRRAWFALPPAVLLLAGCGRRESLPDPIVASPMAARFAEITPPLVVDVAWLQTAMADGSQLIVLDASELARYRTGHIPSSVHAWWQDAMDPNGPAYGMPIMPDANAPDPQRLRRNLIEDLGVTPDDTIVVLDDAAGQHAAMLVWTLRFFGYPKAAMLSGGMATWLGAGGATESRDNPHKVIADAVIDPQDGRYLVKDQVIGRLAAGEIVVVDIRSDHEQQDDVDGTIDLGTIPGAIRLPWDSLFNPETGELRSPETIIQHLADAGIAPDQSIVLFGRFGLEASSTWIVLTMMGFPKIVILSGGWAEWVLDPAAPKVALATPAD